ncbi:Ribonuclease P protein component 4 [Madurella mycetomatis]|uniref:Ribonuclease P protein component 4 n=1 Tax=Madurella mycetomatis TaxID=100816 RepID=A0A175VPR4_9PEZI|nr:Ribonuclease P protein component 4 [Madurella mycetomatis]
MAKGNKGGSGVQNKAIYSRISFLQQAAVFLSSPQHPSPIQSAFPKKPTGQESGSVQDVSVSVPMQGMSRRLATDLRTVSLKTRIRLKPAVKQAICKFCDSVLIDGGSCTSTIENWSKGGRKPWADVLVRKCHTCGKERRYPVSAARSKRKTERLDEAGALRTKQQ